MVFSSAVFLFAFLPIVIILHSLINNNTVRNIILVAASLFFYAWGEPVYVFLLLFSVLFNYFIGKLVAGRKRKPCLVLAVIVNIGLLVVFKYTAFLIELINMIPYVSLPVVQIRMPIGISFFTFQALSYVIDIYSDEEGKSGSFFEVLIYICLFPQLVAGPIVKYNSIKDMIKSRKVDAAGLERGIMRFIVGLGKKMLIANVMAVAADKMFALGGADANMLSAWIGAASYMLQIYFDFSGYSDMAVGMGYMFGLTFPENFNYPYIAASIRDFWKRWHISLTSWFRQYLYFPLGGNRKGRVRTIFNRFFVFVCTGIWHGANLTFLFWGVYHGLLMVAETVAEAKLPKSGRGEKRIVGHIYTLLAVMLGFVIFRADSVLDAFVYIGNMFSFNFSGAGTMYAVSLLSPLFIITFVVALFAATPIVRLFPKNRVTVNFAKLGTILIYVLCIFEIAAGSYNPFIYFRF